MLVVPTTAEYSALLHPPLPVDEATSMTDGQAIVHTKVYM